MEDYIFNTEQPLATNEETMSRFLEDYFYHVFDPEAQVIELDGTYAVIQEGYGSDKKWACHAEGNGDFCSHRISFELVS